MLKPTSLISLLVIALSPALAAPPADETAKSDERVIARVNGHAITMKQLQEPLIEAYGLNMLLNLVQLELAKDQARRAGISVGPDDVIVERDLTMKRMFPDAEKEDYETLLSQFLQNQRLTAAEFNIVLQINAHLRKIAEPQIRGKINEEALQEAHRQVYGETVRVRHIQTGNMTEIVDAKRRIEAGEPFEQVAYELSRNARTAPLGGELPPFSRAATAYPQSFRDAAFALKIGEVSDPVQADGYFHLIKLESRIEPKAVKFEDVRESLREDLEDKLIQAGMQQLRLQIGDDALRTLKIDEPVLRDQYARRLESRDATIRDQDQIRREFQKERERLRQQQEQELNWSVPDTSPTTQPEAPIKR